MTQYESCQNKEELMYQLDLYRSSSIGGVFTVMMDDQFTLAYGNDLYFRLHRYKSEELLNKSCKIFIFPEDLPRVEEALGSAKKMGKLDAEWTMRIKCGDGAIKETLVSGMFNVRNGQEVFDGYVTDITKQSELEAKVIQLTESEKELRKQVQLYRTTHLGGVFSVIMDEDFTLLYGNDRYYSIHEYTVESMRERLGNKCRLDVHPDDLNMVKKTISDTLQEGKTYAEWVMRVVTGNKNIRYILCSGTFDTKPEFTVMNGVVMDITKQKETELALRESEEKFRIATQNADIAFWTYFYDSKKIVQTVNSQLIHGHGMVVENVPQSLVDTGYIREDSIGDFLEMYERLKRGEHTVSGDFWFRNSSGIGWWCEHIDYTNILDDDGKPIKAYAIGRDITANKIAENKYNEELSFKKVMITDDIVASMRVDLTTGDVEEVTSQYAEITQGYAGKNYDECIDTLSGQLINEGQRISTMEAMRSNKLKENFKNGETEKKVIVQRRLPNGTYKWTATTIKLFQKPNSKHIVGFLYSHDIDAEMSFKKIMELIANTNYDFIGQINAINNSYTLFSDKGIQLSKELGDDNYESAVASFLKLRMNKESREEVLNQLLISVITKELENKQFYSVECVMSDELGITGVSK